VREVFDHLSTQELLCRLDKLESLAERSGMLGPLLQRWGEIYCDHPELGEEGLTILRRLRSFYQDQDQKEWAHACMDIADYLGRLGRWEEGRKEYENLLREMPGFPLAHIRFARFMARGGHIDEAVHHYRQVLQSEAKTGKDAFVQIAAEELKALASRHGLELDAWTREAIKQWCGKVEGVPERP
jgi:tetratricopeptide (TPR) repeat protein